MSYKKGSGQNTLYVTYKNGKIVYSGDETIIFDRKPLPAYKKAFQEENHHDMRGAIVVSKKGFMNVKSGMRGIVYEVYQDFDYSDKYGWSIIFESGSYDGFSVNDRKMLDMVELIGIYPPAQNYKFTNVMQLQKDFEAGMFKFK